MRALLLPRESGEASVAHFLLGGPSVGVFDPMMAGCAHPNGAAPEAAIPGQRSDAERIVSNPFGGDLDLTMPIGLVPVSLSGGVGGYDEEWVQKLLFAHPELIPMERIEAGAGEVLPLCRELPIARTGGVVYLDMLAVTRTGRLVLVECKLWRNPQARREVVAQVIEYAGLMRGWSFGDLTARLKQRCGWTGANPIFDHARTLWPDLDEASFVDRISRSLDSADFHLIIAGDGIRSDVQVLAQQINAAGSKARLSLVEIQIWRGAGGQTVVLPCVPLKTEVIEQRVIVAAADGPELRVQEVRIDDPNTGRGTGRERADDEASIDRTVNPERAASNERMRRFWRRFIETTQFDHPEQTNPSYGGPNWTRVALPDGYRLSVYRVSGSETMGVYMPLSLAKDAALLARIEAELDGMRQESGLDLQMVPRDGDPTALDLLVYTSSRGLSEDEQRVWLKATANSMVTLLRPKLSTWKQEAKEAQPQGAEA